MSRTRKRIPEKVLLSLWSRAAGRCELCGKELDVAHAFDQLGNFGQVAHINAYSPGGPRYKADMTEDELNGIDNLMLLCHEHHKMIDDNAEDYPEGVLKRHKADWEDSIAGFVEGLAPSRVLVATMLLPAGGMSPHVTAAERSAALHRERLYAANTKAYDFAKGVAIPCRLQEAGSQIERRMAAFEDLYDDQTMPVAVFALAPQPLLIKLGSLLGGMRDVRVFQPCRGGRGWAWPEGGNPIDFSARQIGDGQPDSSRASLVVSLSGVVSMRTVVDIPDGTPVYELTTMSPGTEIVTCEETVRTFVKEATSLVDKIHESFPGVRELHVYPAMPASLALALGTALRFNLISNYVVHEKADGTFGETLCIGRCDEL